MIQFATSNACVYVLAWINNTELLVYPTQNLAAGTYTLYYGATQDAEGSSTMTNLLRNAGAAAIGGGFSVYNTGNASQSTTTVTGTSTTFTAAMMGGIILWPTASGLNVAYIRNFLTATSLTVTPSQTVAVGPYVILYGGMQVYQGNVGMTGAAAAIISSPLS